MSLGYPYLNFLYYMSSFNTIEKKVNHFISTSDYSADQIFSMIQRSIQFKIESKFSDLVVDKERPLTGKTIALIFSKRSTRTRVSTESAISYLGNYQTFAKQTNCILIFFLNRRHPYVPGPSRYST